MIPRFFALLCVLFAVVPFVEAQVVINEIHYHPVEEPAFNPDGTPVLDLTEDIHEFVEIHNVGTSPVDLGGWALDDGIQYVFPAGTTIPAGGYTVIAKNVERLGAVYPGLTGILGPYAGQLSNGGETVKLKDAAGTVLDSVSYSASFPWAVSADAFGAGPSFLGIDRSRYQYKGRSLERVSPAAFGNDAANWVASPLSQGPSPGAANAQVREVPKPVVISYSVLQAADEAPVIRAAQPVNVDVVFSSVEALSNVELEWFVDDVNSFDEVRTAIAMNPVGNGRFTTATSIPGQGDRSIVRWRIKADRGTGVEVVSPRADDPQIASVGPQGTREAWHGYFVEPQRPSTRPIYDFFISDANVLELNTNISQDPRRVLSSGYPRDDPKDGYYPPNPRYNPNFYPADGQPHWDGVVPAVFVRSGVVHDVVARYHGSRYQRSPDKNSWKISFPAYRLMDGKQRILVTEKDERTILGLALFHKAGLPAGYAQFVDFYKNGQNGTRRCEISDADEETVKQYQAEVIAANPQDPPVFDGLGIIYKSKGLDGNEGPFGWANGQPMPVTGQWMVLDRYIHSFPSQLNDWMGSTPMRTMVDELWAARGDRAQVIYPSRYAGRDHNDRTNVPVNMTTLRAYLNANWDVDKMLSYLAIRNWGSPWDDKFHNHYVYKQPNGLWTMVPWDFDNEMSGGATGEQGYTNSIFAGRKNDLEGDYSNNSRGPNWFKDSILRAFEAEYRQRMFILNNTLLRPENIQAVASEHGISVPSSSWATNRFNSINAQVGLGDWHAPARPAHLAPASGEGIVPPVSFTTSPYAHSSGNAAGGNAHAATLWEIRRADRTYENPTYKVRSSTDLTTHAVPFHLLEFGQSYYWRVTYFDANGHPSTPSQETAFGFGPRPTDVALIAFTESWQYTYTAAFSNNSWTLPAFDDSTWLSGSGVFAFENRVMPVTVNTTLPDPRSLTPSGRAFYFRKRFNFPGNPASSTIRIRHLLDDGCVIWINGQRVHRYLMNDRPNYAHTDFATSTPEGGDAVLQFADAITDADTEDWSYIDPRPFLVQGENVIAVEVHQNNGTSSDVVFGLEIMATVITSGGDVALNEVLADNRSGVTNGGSRPDYVEIRNNTAAPVDLTGWSLSDDVLEPNKFVFPDGTTIPAAGRLVVWCDNDFGAPGLHTGFGLSRNGQTVVLFQGTNVRDYVTFGPQAADFPIGRVPDGVGNWALIAPSPNAANAAQPLGSTGTLKINEWMASPGSGEDWVELYNPAALPVRIGELWWSDTPGTAITQLPALSFIGPKGYTQFEASGLTDGGHHLDFKLSGSGDNLILYDTNGTTIIDSLVFGGQAPNVSQGRLPDGSGVSVSFPGTSSPGESNWAQAPVVINEALSSSVAPLVDQIELHNPTGSAVDIGNWWLSDDESFRQKYKFPAGTTVPAGGYLVVTEADFNTGANAFGLSTTGDEIVLTAVDGAGVETGYRAQVNFGAAAENVSFGRILTGGAPEFWPMVSRTFNAQNSAPVIGPVLINEVHYHPPDVGGQDNARDEFVELHNPANTQVAIAGWRLKGASSYTFPAGAVLRPGEYALVVGFDPADAGTLTAFRNAYGLGDNVQIFGPHSGKLPNSTGEVEIAYPGTPSGGVTPYINVDKVEYADFAPWPENADGDGPSLQRQSRAIIGNDVANWLAAAPTPGAVNYGQDPVLDGDSDSDGIPDVWEDLYGLDKFTAADAALDLDGDGQSNLAEFLAATAPNDGTDVLAATVDVAEGGTGFTVRFSAKAGKPYRIRCKNAPTDAEWTTLLDVPAGAERQVEHTDPTTEPQRFYQIILLPQE